MSLFNPLEIKFLTLLYARALRPFYYTNFPWKRILHCVHAHFAYCKSYKERIYIYISVQTNLWVILLFLFSFSIMGFKLAFKCMKFRIIMSSNDTQKWKRNTCLFKGHICKIHLNDVDRPSCCLEKYSRHNRHTYIYFNELLIWL
jgi:hypothetical protein